jgi:hypothetical protein
MSTTETNGNGVNAAIGLPGFLGRYAQAGAVGLIAVLLFIKVVYLDPQAISDQREFARQAHADFRDHDDKKSTRMWQALNNLADEMRRFREGLE